jgi:nitrate/nitrite transport system permease protein
MTAIDTDTLEAEARRTRRFTTINKADAWFQVFGLAWMTPILKEAAGDNPRAQAGEIWRLLGVPLLAITVFLIAWGTLAPKVQTSLGAIPGPAQVWEQAVNLNEDAKRERVKEAAFYER